MGVRRKFNFLSRSAIKKNHFRSENSREGGKYFTMHKFNVDITQEIKSEFLFFSVKKRANDDDVEKSGITQRNFSLDQEI